MVMDAIGCAVLSAPRGRGERLPLGPSGQTTVGCYGTGAAVPSCTSSVLPVALPRLLHSLVGAGTPPILRPRCGRPGPGTCAGRVCNISALSRTQRQEPYLHRRRCLPQQGHGGASGLCRSTLAFLALQAAIGVVQGSALALLQCAPADLGRAISGVALSGSSRRTGWSVYRPCEAG